MKSFEKVIADGLEAANAERAAQGRLQTSEYAALKVVTCRFRQGKLMLHGHVPSYFHKQLAQEAVRTLPGVTEIVNHITVTWKGRPRRVGRLS